MRKRYIGWSRWRYKLKDGRTGTVENKVPEGNYQKDESFARYLVRKELGLKRLPTGTRIYPDYPPS